MGKVLDMQALGPWYRSQTYYVPDLLCKLSTFPTCSGQKQADLRTCWPITLASQ